MTYNDIYTALQLLDIVRALQLPTKAATEVLVIRAAYIRAIRALAQIQAEINSDASSNAEAKEAAFAAVAYENVEGERERRLSLEAFGSVVEAAAGAGWLEAFAIAFAPID